MDIRKRLLRKPFTTALWCLLCTAVSAFLLVAVSMWLTTDRMARQLDQSHTAIAARIDPRGHYEGPVTDRHFTKEDAEQFLRLKGVKTLHLHTVSAAASPLFHPLIEMNRHRSFQGNGDCRPYCNAVFCGTVIGESYPDLKAGELGYIDVKLEKILLLGAEYCEPLAMADSALRYDGSFCVAACPLDQEAADYIRKGETYIFSGYYDIGFPKNIFEDVYADLRSLLMLGGVRLEDGVLIGGYDYPRSPSSEEAASPETVYTFPAVERLEDVGKVASSESFFEQTDHEIWRAFRETWQKQQTSLPVIGTDKLEALYSFLSQRAVIKEGRTFSQEEYETGAAVAILSRQIADRAGLKPGDTLSLEQYTGTFEETGILTGLSPLRGLEAVNKSIHNPLVDLLNMHQQYAPAETFTLVGIYELEENWAEGSYDFTPNTVLIPRKAQIAGAAGELPDEGDFFGLTFSFELENGHVDEFRAALETSSFAGEFYAFDQGYESVQKNLDSAVRAMGRLLLFSLLTWCIFQIFYLLTAQESEKKNLGIMRSLGTDPGRCGRYLFVGGFMIAFAGTAAGSLIGRTLTEKIRQGILQDILAGLDPGLTQEAAETAKAEIMNLMAGSHLTAGQLLLIAGAELLLTALLLLVHTGIVLRRPPRKLMEG